NAVLFFHSERLCLFLQELFIFNTSKLTHMNYTKRFLALFLIVVSTKLFAQLPAPALLGYWQNWNTSSSPYFVPDQADARYNMVAMAFAVPRNGTDYDMVFTPTQTTPVTLRSQIQNMQAQGRKVLISIGGANDPIVLSNANERDVFISSMNGIINYYGFDGLDIDVEGGSLSVTSGTTISNPTDAPVVNMIAAIKAIMANYANGYGRKMVLTMAPETAYVQGGMSNYSGLWGAYLPLIHALRDSIDMLNVQLYNSGTMYGIDGRIYSQGTADFIVSQTEAVIRGFQTNGGYFTGLPAEKVGIGLPACSNAAGGGYVAPATVLAAANYLLGKGPKPGTYTLAQFGGYPNLRGMMTWSINWDRVSTCGGSYSFAQNFETIFGSGGGNPCPTPTTPSISNITTASATATWSAVSGATGYTFRYKPVSAVSYTQVNVGVNSYNLTGLIPGTAYTCDVLTVCSSGNSVVSSASNFITTSEPGGCDPPAGLLVKNIKFNSATATWNVVSGAGSYELQYIVKGVTGNWTSKVVSGTSSSLSGLQAGTVYQTRVRSICSGVQSAFAPVVEFETPQKGGRKAAGQIITANGQMLELELSPNPVVDRLLIHTNVQPGAVIAYRLVSMQGQALQSGNIVSSTT
ncbi:MAG TPA: glycosyl hydrolase family 18 protein, partial [Anaerolineae bacterium]|nr:glycosyl hydrolase family 18 protein [Anaerolineae bacterium]